MHGTRTWGPLNGGVLALMQDSNASLLEEGLAGRKEHKGWKAMGLEPPDGKGPLRYASEVGAQRKAQGCPQSLLRLLVPEMTKQ